MAYQYPQAFYYLENFHQLLSWVQTRYEDLLDADEVAFLQDFQLLPMASQALLVRMIMRKGEWFRESKLQYEEIGAVSDAAGPLLEKAWLQSDDTLDFADFVQLITKPELVSCFTDLPFPKSARKEVIIEHLLEQEPAARPWSQWFGAKVDPLFTLTIRPIIDRLRLMYFGNLYQDLTEFVVTDLGLFKYEPVASPTASDRAFSCREDVDAYLEVWQLREKLEVCETQEDICELIEQLPHRFDNPWLERRRGKLIYRLAYQLERGGQLDTAYQLYEEISYPGARERQIRLLEKEKPQRAWQLLKTALEAPTNEQEFQACQRIGKRLAKKLDETAPTPTRVPSQTHLTTIQVAPDSEIRVEELARLYFHSEHQPAFNIENRLINSLFGLLFWPAVFAPIPGAFFHPFQAAPSDLGEPEFESARQQIFDQQFNLLREGNYQAFILDIYEEKQGTISPFVHWDGVDQSLLRLAMDCIPKGHLEVIFKRILFDIKANRSGLPDLIQFFPQEENYRMIEIKGPGDRLQDNQLRWIDWFERHNIPYLVCHVEWSS